MSGRVPGIGPSGQPVAHPIRFTGRGDEYFRIWIVNLLLTIATLGIYSAWAKVRRLQYFHRNTELAGARLDYHGRPVAILLGRLVGLAIFLPYAVLSKIGSPWQAAAFVMLLLVMPWLLWRSLRFRLAMTSWRGLRFSFAGTKAGAYGTFLGFPLLGAISFLLLFPLAHRQLRSYVHSNARFGDARFGFNARARSFYFAWALGFVSIVAASFIAGLVVAELGNRAATVEAGIGPIVLAALIGSYAGMLLLAIPIVTARVHNAVWNGTSVEGQRFEARLGVWRWVWVSVSNLALIAVTLGLFTPFAQIRAARTRIESLSLVGLGDLDAAVATQTDAVGASGDATADVFGIDIAL